MKADSCATRVWLFYKRLVLYLVGGFAKKTQNNKNTRKNRNAQTSVFSVRPGESFELLTRSRVCAFSSCLGKQATNRRGREPQERAFAVNGCAGCFVSELVSCGSSRVCKGAEGAGGVL